jgi:hypothetical protein
MIMFKTTLAAGALALATLFSATLPALALDPAPTSAVQAAAPVAPAVLSAAERAALQYMREEEKLAHDVYVTLYDLWGLRVFSNISASEQQHTSAVAALLSRYGVSDPAAGNAVGEFTDPALQQLYDELIAQSSTSVAAALKVGAAIEEIDILDLQERVGATTHADIVRVYSNLLAGSENHLRAFVSNLERQTGTAYVPSTWVRQHTTRASTPPVGRRKAAATAAMAGTAGTATDRIR